MRTGWLLKNLYIEFREARRNPSSIGVMMKVDIEGLLMDVRVESGDQSH